MKKIKILGVFIIFILSIGSHFIYELIPNNIFSILFPVNESIWEHMKLLVTPVLIFSLLEYCIYRKKDINFNNFILSYSISIIIGIISYLVLYLPIHYIFGHSPVYAIILLFVIFIFIEIVSYYIMSYNKIKNSNIIGVTVIIIIYIIVGYLTYYPLENDLFIDSQTNTYGIEKE